MANAKRDNNQISVMLGLLNSDGSTPVMIKADPTSHILDTNSGNTGSDNNSEDEAFRDDNQITTMLAVSESDGTTPVQLYADSDGKLLVDPN